MFGCVFPAYVLHIISLQPGCGVTPFRKSIKHIKINKINKQEAAYNDREML